MNPAEVRLGLQANLPGYRALSMGFAWQRPLNNAGDGQVRTSNLQTPAGKGDINFSELVDPALAAEVGAFFAQNGVTRPASTSKAFATNNPAFDDWRNVRTTRQPVLAQGNNSFVVFMTWRIH